MHSGLIDTREDTAAWSTEPDVKSTYMAVPSLDEPKKLFEF
jgi:hypothetical protein